MADRMCQSGDVKVGSLVKNKIMSFSHYLKSKSPYQDLCRKPKHRRDMFVVQYEMRSFWGGVSVQYVIAAVLGSFLILYPCCRYKGMTRFKHLISHDLEGVFTPTQIGRRLQQLGCVQPRKRRSILADMSDDQGENHQYKSSTDDDHRSETEKVSNDSDEILGISNLNILPGSDSGFKASWGSSSRKNVQKKSEAGNIKPNCKKPDSTITIEKESVLSQESESDDDLPIAQHMSVKRIFGRRITRPEPEQKSRIKDGFESDNDDDEPIVHKMSTKETPKRKEEVQQEQVEIVSGVVDIEGEQPVQKSPKRTYERKQKPQLDQQHMEKDTWGDSDTGNICVALF
jgi:hypothetical protein